ncbi:hypothetical protein BDB00DRAFT_921909 [Zychaea mexicana]|uniref:uncharacterized protein n=1 Tax=Zychaea mexicana TaxID=64656 RepID=UPI0022FE1846|nr:uncharacterized protein BDB00DRAFT_921909 [Zychaea mexicana]KAI9489023.1 hypothetical protein BDB00DRAFT_921909 [Zychaea mexicana]
MPKKYYCDFCKCSFPDNVTNRQNHINGAVHKANRKLHYDWFKDPDEYIHEQASKPPCRRYLMQGYCEYQLQCRYSHITYDPAGRPIYPPELTAWLQERQQADATARAQAPVATPSMDKPKYRLPRGWKVRELPPSLKPPPPSPPYSWSNAGVWG